MAEVAATRAVIWDFDGTLAYRDGMWSGCLIEVLDEHEPGHGVTLEQLRPYLRDGFPWHRADVPHPELCEPEAWWTPIEALLARAFERTGASAERARTLATLARRRYVDPAAGWRLFDDVVPVLGRLASAGRRHVVLSNHVPELPELVSGLGLPVDAVLTSAALGFEKPHPEAFARAVEACHGAERIVVVGDNPVADVGGAEAVGLPAILVRSAGGLPDLYAVERLL